MNSIHVNKKSHLSSINELDSSTDSLLENSKDGLADSSADLTATIHEGDVNVVLDT